MSKWDVFNSNSAEIIRGALTLAFELKHGFTGSEHILLSISKLEDSSAAQTLLQAGYNYTLIKELLQKYDKDAAEAVRGSTMSMSTEAERILELSKEQAVKLHHDLVEPEHILLAILLEKNSAAAQLLLSTEADFNQLIRELMDRMGIEWPKEAADSTKEEKNNKVSIDTLEQFSKDLTAVAMAGGFDPVIGREKEVKRMIQILSRRNKNNPVLIGEPGVGKTSIAEGLAQAISEERVPKNLLNKRILSLDLGKMVSGTKFRGDFEERIKSYLEEAQAAGNVIIFIDELHTLVGAGASEGALDAANTFKPALGRGEIQVIGATTLKEYKKYIEKDAALERRFQPVMVNEPSRMETVEILKGIKEKYEQFHELTISESAILAAVELSDRYIQDRYLPDKAIDLIDEAAAAVRADSMTVPPKLKKLEEEIQFLQKQKQAVVAQQNFEEAAEIRDKQKALRGKLEREKNKFSEGRNHVIEAEDIAGIVSTWTGVPVTILTQTESDRLMRLEEILHERVIGQEEAVCAVAKAIRRSRTGIRAPHHPVGSFLFLGPTGVGKTELSKALAEAMIQDENAVIRIDMSEYMERHTVSKLIGSPPGYVGYDEGGQLTERVRRKPYSVVLFDEIEKAHPDVWNTLLQIMDDGRLTDGQGRTVDFKNTIIIMTSNIGARDILGRKSLGFGNIEEEKDEVKTTEEIRSQIMAELKNTFQPEFLNRLDDIIVFHQLDKKHIYEIADKLLKDLKNRSGRLGFGLEIDKKAVEILAMRGYDPVYGARPLQRVLQSALEDAIADKMLKMELAEGDKLIVTGKDDEIIVKVRKKRKSRVPVLV
jgi:ATP-dependent Clp protease ATP-binding subunit ClpC